MPPKEHELRCGLISNRYKKLFDCLWRYHEWLRWLAETLWLRRGLHEQAGSAPRVIEKGVVCWPHGNRGLLLAKPIRMFGERR